METKNKFFKKVLRYCRWSFVAIIVTISFSSCDRGIVPVLLTSDDPVFEYDATTPIRFDVKTNVSWTYKHPAEWISVVKGEDYLEIAVNPYNGTEIRTADMKITAAALSKVVRITQRPRDRISILPTSVSFEYNETGSKPVVVTTSCPTWDARADADWLTLTKQNNNLLVSVTENRQYIPRSANVVVSGGNAESVTFPVTQKKISYKEPPFGEIPESSYTATGESLNSLSGSSWTGDIKYLISYTYGTYYNITNWGGKDITVSCDYKDGKIMIDNVYSVAQSTLGFDYYFMAIPYDEATKYYDNYILDEWEVRFDIETMTLDFSGYYNGLPVAVGVFGFDSSNNLWTASSHVNVKLQLTPKLTTSSAQMLNSGKKEGFLIDDAKKVKIKSAINKGVTLFRENPKIKIPQKGG
ncbi:MAG: BACON domain-containing protein [Tannerella sp.]|jgi:hypothetical protein|nr:BACON domain-containing protein [Tannerella sp.]